MAMQDDGDMELVSRDFAGRLPGRKRVDPPAKPGDNHAGYINDAIDDFLSKDPAAGPVTLDLQVVVNPGSIKEYRVIPRSS